MPIFTFTDDIDDPIKSLFPTLLVKFGLDLFNQTADYFPIKKTRTIRGGGSQIFLCGSGSDSRPDPDLFWARL